MDCIVMGILCPDRHDGLSDVYPSNRPLGLTKSTSHPSLEPVEKGVCQWVWLYIHVATV